MIKNEIERIALEVAKGIQVPLMPEGTAYFVTADLAIELCTRFLARIDAERGKSAVAWFAFADNNGPVPLELWGFDEKACKYAVLENARSIGWKGTIEGYLLHMRWTIRPLFLSAPTIPPSKEPGDHYACGWNACRDAMIAAAQGERNAD